MNVEELKAIVTSQRQALEELFRREHIIERDWLFHKIEMRYKPLNYVEYERLG